jgi:signal transduction histidine kinase
MKKRLFTQPGEPGTRLKKLVSLRHSVAFRLTVWYAGVFAVSLLGAFLVFYMRPLRGNLDISHHTLSELREGFRHYLGAPLIAMIFLSAGVGWLMAKRALSGVEEVTRAAVDITNGSLDRRVPVAGRQDEIDLLADAFNTMVDRIQGLIGQMKEITENIAHDLRSPITRMRGIAELALTAGNSDEDHTAMAGTIIEECDRLLAMINAMLDISEAESGLMKLNQQRIDLVDLVRDVCDLFQPLAENRNIRIDIEAPGSAPVLGDLKKIQRILSNLVDNALKYTPGGGSVNIVIKETAKDILVIVKDTGNGIPEKDLPHIFDRFFRGEKSRSTPGNGLGLSLAQAFVLIHGGTITATNIPEKGSQFTVILPRIALSRPENGYSANLRTS